MRFNIYSLLIFILFTASIIAQNEQAAKSKYDVFSFECLITKSIFGFKQIIFKGNLS